ncbi:MAG: hypothetical protein LV481_11515 [Methylacidiphilales bacterium]|nr:hypothetical protein [Candidatus Methylacidiphilales bacterium]
MASIFTRKRSPYYWIKTRDVLGNWRNSSTGIRIDEPGGRRRALAKAHTESAAEPDLRAGRTGQALSAWVPQFLKNRYEARQPKAYQRYTDAWAALAIFLDEKRIATASQVTRHLAKQYPYWRVEKHQGLKKVKWNTALFEIKLLGLVMQEALERNQITGNPCFKLGFKREATKETHAITVEHQALIERKLKELNAPEWMHVSWAIAIRQGCRIGATSVPMERIDLKSKPPVITFFSKGKFNTAPLHPELLPMMRRFKKEKRAVTCTLPKCPGRVWQNWLWRKLKLTQYSFHCTRRTVVTRLSADNWQQPMVKDYVGHASTTVNDVYRRLKPRDLVSLSASLTGAKPEIKGAP